MPQITFVTDGVASALAPRYFGDFTGAEQLLADPAVVVQGKRVTHLHHRMRRPR